MNKIIRRDRSIYFGIKLFWRKWTLKEDPQTLSLKEFSYKNLLLRSPSKTGMSGEDNLKELFGNHFLPLDVRVGLIILKKKKDILEFWREKYSISETFYVYFDGTKINNNGFSHTFFLKAEGEMISWGIKKIDISRKKNEFSVVIKKL